MTEGSVQQERQGRSEYVFKVVVIGEWAVGKTSLIRRYATSKFSDIYTKTAGADFTVKKIDFEQSKISLLLWDLAGDEHFRWIIPTYLEGLAGIIYVIDCTKERSLTQIKDRWMKIINERVRDSHTIPSIILINKVDLIKERVISLQYVKDFFRNFNFPIFETSAKTGENIELSFEKLTRNLKGLF